MVAFWTVVAKVKLVCAHAYMVLAKLWSSISVALHSVLFLVFTVTH